MIWTAKQVRLWAADVMKTARSFRAAGQQVRPIGHFLVDGSRRLELVNLGDVHPSDYDDSLHAQAARVGARYYLLVTEAWTVGDPGLSAGLSVEAAASVLQWKAMGRSLETYPGAAESIFVRVFGPDLHGYLVSRITSPTETDAPIENFAAIGVPIGSATLLVKAGTAPEQ